MSLTISVVIPSYKSSAFIEATLESVARQTYPHDNLEILVIDDASPDDSAAVARRFLERFPLKSKVLVSKANAGAAATRNVGWKMASGDWIQFLDQDDLLAPHKIELQAVVAAQCGENVAVVYSNWQEFLLKDDKWQPEGPLNAPFVDDDPILRILQQYEFGFVGPTLIRKSFLSKIGGFIEKPNLGEDCELMLRLAMAGGQFKEAHSDRAAFFYRQSPGSLWRAYVKNTVAMQNILLGFREIEMFLRRQNSTGNLSGSQRQALAHRYSRHINFYFENDRDFFRLVMGWLKGLGYFHPLDKNMKLRMISRIIGYENALRMRGLLLNLIRRRAGSPAAEQAR
jgi:glycosyltransferase involved in cell wall biosynthesis